jgi:hypothetical protein
MRPFRLAAFGLTILFLAGCAPKKAIVGKWKENDSNTSIEFFPNGTVLLNGNRFVREMIGDYSKLDEHRIRVDLKLIKVPFIFSFSVSGNEMDVSCSELFGNEPIHLQRQTVR